MPMLFAVCYVITCGLCFIPFSPLPTITSFTPTNGMAGSVVKLTGKNFTGVTAVAMNGSPVSNVTVLSATHLTFTVPNDATSGKITVLGPGGIGTSTTGFSVTLVPGSMCLNPVDHAVMIWVPGASFTMGTDYCTAEYPTTQQVTISGYWIYKYEVTVAQYRQFCNETGHRMPKVPSMSYNNRWRNGWTDNHPIVNVTWAEAKAYVQWAGVSLTTEAQWEYAARGPQGNNYPWGYMATAETPYNGWDATKCASSVTSQGAGTFPVGSFPEDKSWCGVMDMAGNVSEYCRDYYGKYSRKALTNPTGPITGLWCVARGGSWLSTPLEARGATRVFYTLDGNEMHGFRCATSPTGP